MIHSQHSEKSFFFQKHDFEIYISEKVSQNSEYLSHISDLFFSELWLIYTKITDILSYNSDFFCIQKPKKVSNDLVYFLFCGRNRLPYILVPFERVAPQYLFFLWVYSTVGVFTSRRLQRKCRRFPGTLASKTRYMGIRRVWQYNILTIFSCLLAAMWKRQKSTNSVASGWFDPSETRRHICNCVVNS